MRHGVILAGGGGTRLWPASRRACPKQFLPLGTSAESLLSATARRLETACESRLCVVTAADQTALVQAALPALETNSIIAEPSARNTAPALGLAAIHLLHRDPDAVMAAIPSDQHIDDEDEFRRIAGLAFAAAETHEAIITVGIVPTRPETGYGYLRVGESSAGELRVVRAFVEKPDDATAAAYIESGEYLWNGGMFFVKAAHLLDQIRTHLPDAGRGLDEIAAALGTDQARQVCQRVYPTLPSISIDYGVMERATSVMTIAGDFGWNDVGSWPALAEYMPSDDDGNVKLGSAVVHDSNNNIVVSDPGHLVALAGVSNMIVVQSGDAVLVVPRERAQDVRALVDTMRVDGLERFL